MSVENAIAAIRFGTGRNPSIPDPSGVDPLLSALAGADEMAARYPIDSFDVLYPLQREVRRLSREAKKDKKHPAHAAKREIYKDERVRQVKNLRSSLARWVDTRDPLRERLTRFWADHFTTIGRGGLTRRAVSLHVEDAVRPNVAGRFADLLKAAVTHPMMLVYLDQARSVGPNSRVASAQPERGLNENLAREVLELHTLGVGDGYTQTDVRELAELFTGLTIHMNEGFRFNQRMAEPGAETVLGISYGDGRPALDDIHKVLDDLAVHPMTAKHIATKLVRHFISDTPSEDMVKAVETAFNESQGDLAATYRAMLGHSDALAGPLQKAKQPFDIVATSLRATGLTGSDITQVTPRDILRFVVNPMRRMGQTWEIPTGPDGWPEDEAHWITPQGLAARIQWAMAVGVVPGLKLPDPRAFLDDALGPLSTERLQFAVGAAESKSDGIGLVLASPNFQRR
jgi:uncharacterized protein (DUF1800 family)